MVLFEGNKTVEETVPRQKKVFRDTSINLRKWHTNSKKLYREIYIYIADVVSKDTNVTFPEKISSL